MLERVTDVVGVECRLVVLGTELFGVAKEFTVAKLFASVLVHSEVVPEVVALELAMVLDHEVVGLGDERFDDASGNRWMVERAERVTDVVDQCAEYVLVVFAVFLGSCRRLQAVLQAVDREAAVVLAEFAEQPDDSVSDKALGDAELGRDDGPVFSSRFFEALERRALVSLGRFCSVGHGALLQVFGAGSHTVAGTV